MYTRVFFKSTGSKNFGTKIKGYYFKIRINMFMYNVFSLLNFTANSLT